MRRYAMRPTGYGRALVYKVVGMLRKSGLLDVKGAGAKSPKQESHGNGLLSTAEAIREMLFTNLVETVLQDAVKRAEVNPEFRKLLEEAGVDPKVGMKIVGTYGVIDWGFDLVNKDGTTEPAGAVLRQGHQRPKFWQSFFLEKSKGLALEKLLRHYGITSTGAYRLDPKVTVDWINLQATRDGKAIYDVGAFMAAESHYTRALTHFDDSENILSKPGDPDFVQPDPEIEVDHELWGVSRSGKLDVTYDNPTIYSRETIMSAREKFAEGKVEEGLWFLKKHFDNFLGHYRAKLEATTNVYVLQMRKRNAETERRGGASPCNEVAAAVL
jgi:hypothetical protein